jgi:hypothetical protein
VLQCATGSTLPTGGRAVACASKEQCPTCAGSSPSGYPELRVASARVLVLATPSLRRLPCSTQTRLARGASEFVRSDSQVRPLRMLSFLPQAAAGRRGSDRAQTATLRRTRSLAQVHEQRDVY